jgi:hypothetical protein
MSAVAVGVPLMLHQPAWIEGAIASAGCALVAWVFIAVLLYVQPDLEEDLVTPNLELRVPSGNTTDGGLVDAAGCADVEGCAAILALIFAGILIFLAFTLLFELLLPGVIFLLFWPLRRGLARLMERHPECSGHPALSVAWSGLWSLVTIGPVALVVCSLLYWLKPH